MSAIVKKSEAKDKDVVLPKAGTYSRASKPIVLSSQRFNKIVNNATTTDSSKAAAEAKEILEYKEKLKAGNDELVAQFKGNMQRTQEEKLQQIKEQMDKKTKQGKRYLDKICIYINTGRTRNHLILKTKISLTV